MAKNGKKQQAPVERIERWPLERVVAYANNPRTHTPQQVDQIAASMNAFGQAQLVVVDEKGEIVVGHGRVLAAQQLGWKQVIVGVAVGWSAAQKRAYRLADNQIGLTSGWDVKLLQMELSDLQLANFDLNLLGFDDLKQLMAGKVGQSDPEDVPPVPATPIVLPGDLWTLGEHRLLCGDCTDAEDVARLMDGERACLMNTDPPYGVDYGGLVSAIRGKGRKGKYKDIIGDELDGKELQDFLETSIRTALPHLVDNPAFYLWHPMLTQGTFFAAAAAAADILIHRQIIWVKPSLIMGRGDYHWRHELCFYGWIRGKRCAWLKGRDQNTVWEIGRENDNIHPTQKPTELFVRPIENHVPVGGAVYEPFSGSGSQIIAAEMTARRCYALEISPAYVQVAIERWQKFSGKQAVHEDGRDFETVSRERKRKSRPKGGPSVAEALAQPAR